MIWRIRTNRKAKELREAADAASEQLRNQEPRVNALADYLERRKNVNGFGEDFEWALKAKGTS